MSAPMSDCTVNLPGHRYALGHCLYCAEPQPKPAPMPERQLAEIAANVSLPDRDALRQMVADALGQHPNGRDANRILDLVEAVVSGATKESDADHRQAYRLLAKGFNERGAEVKRLAGRVVELTTELAEVAEYGIRVPGATWPEGGVLLDGDTFDRAGQEDRLERYRPVWPNAELVTRAVTRGAWATAAPEAGDQPC